MLTAQCSVHFLRSKEVPSQAAKIERCRVLYFSHPCSSRLYFQQQQSHATVCQCRQHVHEERLVQC